MNPEANPIIVLDFGAQYSRLIARRVRKTPVRAVFATAALVLTSLSCTIIPSYKFKKITIRDSSGAAVAYHQPDKRTLTIERDGYDIELVHIELWYHGDPTSSLDIEVRIVNHSDEPQVIGFQSLDIAPIKFKTGKDYDGPKAKEFHRFKPLRVLDQADSNVLVERTEVQSNEEQSFSRYGDLPYTLKKGRAKMVFYDYRAESEITADFILYTGLW